MKSSPPMLGVKAVIAGVLLFALPTSIMASQSHMDRVHVDRVEVAFVLDTTGSMAGLIEGAKRKIWSIANTVVDINPNADIRMALVAYRDYGDAYVVKTFDMSSDIQGLYGHLIQFEAAGGGDGPEAVNEALEASVNDLHWSHDDNTRRMIFLVGDAPPHMDYDDGPKYPEVIRQARAAGIIVHAVQAGSSRQTRNIWSDIAQRGGGDYITIPQDGGQISTIETPFDDDIIILQRQLDETVIPYGNQQKQSSVRKKIRLRAMASPSSRVDNSKFYAKRTLRKEVVTGGGDVVSAIQNKDISLGDIRAEELPEEMQSMSGAERKAFIDRKIAGRAEIEKEMSQLVKKHDAYVAKKTKEQAKSKGPDSFDQAVSKAIAKTF